MKGKIIKNPQLNVFQIPLVSVINMEYELVQLAQRIDWKSVDKEFSICYPHMGRREVPVRKMVGSMILKQMYNLGDETFVDRWIENPIAAAWEYQPDDLDNDFFNSDVVVFGGTALVPHIHDNMTSLLKKAKSNGCVTIVNTVFDFRNEKTNPSKKWPLGESDESYKYIDLLIADHEESLCLSGENNLKDAIRFFQEKNVSSFIITNGVKNILTYSDGRFFNTSALKEMPVSQKVLEDLKNSQAGDTTGCGDNFVGGVIASIVSQLKNRGRNPDLHEACCWGVISGGFACFYMGGTYFEKVTGEKWAKMKP